MLRVTRKLLTQGSVNLSEEIDSLKIALGEKDVLIEQINNDNGLLRYQLDQLNYENDELSQIANFRRINSWGGSDS